MTSDINISTGQRLGAHAGQVAMENAVCPVCGAPGTPRFRQHDLYVGVEGEFQQNHCDACDVYFISPRVPELEIGNYYPATYQPYNQNPPSERMFKLAWALGLPQRRRRIVERFVAGGRILDVGCGTGYFLDTLRGGTWTRYAMDIQQQTKFGPLDGFFQGQFDAGKPELANLDVITLWHVFEHLYHPEVALEHARDLLRPGGFLLLAIPDLKCLERFVFGKYWAGWDLPRHLATYSAGAMKTLVERSGMRLVEIVPDACTGDFLALNLELWLRSRGVWRNVHHSLILRALLSPVAFSLVRLGLAQSKVYVAQK